MYWQKRFSRKNPTEEIEQIMKEIRKQHKDYGYRRMNQELRKRGCIVNKKKVQRLMQKLALQVRSFTRKSRKYSSYRGTIGRIAKNLLNRHFCTSVVHQKLQLIQLSSNIMKKILLMFYRLRNFTYILSWICTIVKLFLIVYQKGRTRKQLWKL